MNLFDATIPIFTKMLRNLERWLDLSVEYAGQRKFDPEVLIQARLAPDQYALVGQVQAACDTAKYAAAKMTGKEAPSHPDTERTLAEVRARIGTCVAYLDTFTPAEFEGCEGRLVTHAFMKGKQLRAGDYLDHYVLPNFHFHLTIAYEILRHNGVPLDKHTFFGSLPFQE
jgi:uncharacterized protein